MRLATVFLLTIFTAQISFVYAEGQSAVLKDVLKDEAARLNYSVGYQIGSDFKYQKFEVRSEAVLRGIEDAMSGNKALMTKQEMRQTMADVGKKVADLKQEKRQHAGDYTEKNKQFLLENGKRPGIITTDSGLQYRVVESGGGGGSKHPGLEDKVQVYYHGKLINGQGFDSVLQPKQPASFQVNKVIKGWTEALQLMRRGDRWQLFIPSELAYGEKGAGSVIPPDSTLIFDLEIISIQK